MLSQLPIPLKSGSFLLLETRNRKQTDMLLLAASLAFNQGATIIDGGNHFNAYTVVNAVRVITANLSIINRLQIARAFNCHQIVTLSQQIPLDGRPCLLIDLLDLFQDDNVPYQHRVFLIKKLLYQIGRVRRQAVVVASITPPKEAHTQSNFLASLIRKSSTHTLEEGFMGKTLPTINQIIQQAEVILARFSRVLQPGERAAMDLLFTNAKKHIASISEANHLIPFEAAQQAILLEQQKEINLLHKKLSEIEDYLENK